MNNENIMVSVCCITYNHEKYIRQALDSFLKQKTNFKYEIIVHDDASTDSTQDIIRDYEKKYPDIIKPIYEVENQYQKGKKASLITYKHAKGKYIALCEGDDYWIDENKLQIQVDYLEKNKECVFCFHDAFVLNMKNNKKENWKWYNKKYWKKDGNYNAGELDLLGFIPTASYLFVRRYVENIPNWLEKSIVGDRPTKLVITNYGYAHYINKKMSIYRVGIGNSAMDKINNQNEDLEKAINYWKKIEWIIEQFDCFSEHKYEKELNLSKAYNQINILMAKEDYRRLIKEKKYRQLLRKKQLFKIYLKIYFPKIYNKAKELKIIWKKIK